MLSSVEDGLGEAEAGAAREHQRERAARVERRLAAEVVEQGQRLDGLLAEADAAREPEEAAYEAVRGIVRGVVRGADELHRADQDRRDDGDHADADDGDAAKHARELLNADEHRRADRGGEQRDGGEVARRRAAARHRGEAAEVRECRGERDEPVRVRVVAEQRAVELAVGQRGHHLARRHAGAREERGDRGVRARRRSHAVAHVRRREGHHREGRDRCAEERCRAPAERQRACVLLLRRLSSVALLEREVSDGPAARRLGLDDERVARHEQESQEGRDVGLGGELALDEVGERARQPLEAARELALRGRQRKRLERGGAVQCVRATAAPERSREVCVVAARSQASIEELERVEHQRPSLLGFAFGELGDVDPLRGRGESEELFDVQTYVTCDRRFARRRARRGRARERSAKAARER